MTARALVAPLTLVGLLGLGCGGSLAQEKKPAPASKIKATAKAKADEAPATLATATFGGGCFWCLEAVFEKIPGVKSAVSGYSGGFVERPTYEQVCTGQTGHAEVVQIEYDPERVSYEKLLEVFFHIHDPTTPNAQGPDIGTQYRSVILYHDDDQKKAAQAMYEELTNGRAFAYPIVTELVPMAVFYPAEKKHQDFFRRNKRAAYCQMYIAPKLRKLKLD